MDTVAPKVTIDRNPDLSAAAAAALSSGADAAAMAQDDARARRAALVDRARGEFASGVSAAEQQEAELPPAPARELVDSLEIELPNGMVVLFGPPTGISLAVKMMLFFNGRDPTAGEERITTVMMCIREINGKQVQISDPISRDRVLNSIGDDALVLLSAAYRENWPPPTRRDLKIVRKNLKTPL